MELQAMSSDVRERAAQPEDLSRLIVERLNAGDVEGLVALYEPEAVLALPNGQVAKGTREIRQAYEQLVAGRPTFAPGQQQPTLRTGGLALTSVRLVDGGVTVEVARRQPDGTWLWAIDHPSLVG
jgi:ketosteroid isomerase-like protein